MALSSGEKCENDELEDDELEDDELEDDELEDDELEDDELEDSELEDDELEDGELEDDELEDDELEDDELEDGVWRILMLVSSLDSSSDSLVKARVLVFAFEKQGKKSSSTFLSVIDKNSISSCKDRSRSVLSNASNVCHSCCKMVSNIFGN